MNLLAIQEKIFNIILFIIYASFFLFLFGIDRNSISIVNDIDYYLRIYVCLFLMWRFHPFQKTVPFSNLDRKISFSAGLFIFTSAIVNEYKNETINKLKNWKLQFKEFMSKKIYG
jgi:hypothetical protein